MDAEIAVNRCVERKSAGRASKNGFPETNETFIYQEAK